MLTERDINNFKKLYKQEFGVEVSDEEAREQATKLLNVMSAVYKPMTKQEYEQIQNHCNQTKTALEEYLNNI